MKENGTSGNASVAMFAEGATIINDTGAKIDLQGTGLQIGMYGITNNTDNSVLVNRGTITVGASTGTVPNVGMFSNNTAIIPEQAGGLIDIKDNSYGIYGKSIKMTGGTIKTANNGVGIFATGPSVNLLSGTINVGNKQSVGVFIADDSTPVTTNITGNVNMAIGDNSFGYVITSTTARSQLTTGNSTTATVNEDSVYAYSANPLGKIVNNTNITSTGNKNYALYGNGTIKIETSNAKSSGIWTDNAENVEENAQGINPINNKNQTGTSTPVIKVVAADDMKEVGGVTNKSSAQNRFGNYNRCKWKYDTNGKCKYKCFISICFT